MVVLPRQRDDPVIGRRRFIGGIGFGLFAASIMIRAQQPPKVHRIGCLIPFRGTVDLEAATIGAMIEDYAISGGSKAGTSRSSTDRLRTDWNCTTRLLASLSP